MSSKYYLWGRVDILDRNKKTLWEIKCTSSTDYEHIIQLAMYAWMLEKKVDNKFTYMLLNVCKNEVIRLQYDHEKVTGMIEYLISCKYEKKKALTDTEFIQGCLAHTLQDARE